jgi:hypothetical protein
VGQTALAAKLGDSSAFFRLEVAVVSFTIHARSLSLRCAGRKMYLAYRLRFNHKSLREMRYGSR